MTTTGEGRPGITSDAHGRMATVDALRAVAVVAVVLFHSFPHYVRGGFVGVDIFFVISGFIITSKYYTDLFDEKVTLSEFFKRRIRRLLPALAVLLAIVTAISVVLLYPKGLVNYGQSLVGQAFLVQNIVFWSQGDYFDDPLSKPLLHTWSLGAEDQFYLLYAAAVLLFRRAERTALVALVSLSIFSFFLGRYVGVISPKSSFYLVPFRIWEFAAGILAARFRPRGDGLMSTLPISTFVGMASFAILLFSIAGFDETSVFPGMQAILAVSGTTAICLLQDRFGQTMNALLSRPALQYLGRISYSWYLWHWPPLTFFFVRFGRPPNVLEASCLTLLGLGLGVLSFEFVEQWGTRSKWMTPAVRTFGMLSLVSCLCVFVGAAAIFDSGFVSRYPTSTQRLLVAQMETPPYRCPFLKRALAWSEQICHLNKVTGKGGVLLLGDSHADVLKGPLAELGNKYDVPVYLTKQNCKLTNFGKTSNCKATLWNEIARDIKKHDIADVFAVAYWRDQDPKDFIAASKKALDLQIHLSILKSTPGDRLLDPGTFIDNPSRAVDNGRKIYLNHERATTSEDEVLSHLAAQQPNLTVLDPIPLLCPHKDCLFENDGNPVYSDSNHLTVRGVRLIMPLLEKVIAEAARRAHGSS